MAFFYQVYGLKLKSDLELPELIHLREQPVDVTITVGTVPKTIPGSKSVGKWAEYRGSRCLFQIDNVGRFLIEDGHRIIVHPYGPSEMKAGAAAEPADVRLYLLGSGLAALLHQRGLLPLHVSAVLSQNGAWAFTGPSGAGKSTTAGWLSEKAGLPLISDDVSVADVQDGAVRLHPGPRKLKLWDDAVEFLGLKERNLVRDLSNTSKFQLYLPDDVPESEFILRGIILLERAEHGQPVELTPVTGIDRFRCCCNAVYRHRMAGWFRPKTDYVENVFRISENTRFYRLRRPWSLEYFSDQDHPLRELLFPGQEKEEISE